MADIIAPRRGEPIVDGSGFPTVRFIDYLENTASQSNRTIADTEVDSSSVNLSVGQFAKLENRIAELELLLGISSIETQVSGADITSDLDVTSNIALIGIIAKMQKQIDSLAAQQQTVETISLFHQG